MPRQLLDLDPNKLAAVVYRSEDDVDALLYEFANDLVGAGERVGGVVQQNLKNAGGRRIGMQLIELTTGRVIPMGQSLGSGERLLARSCGSRRSLARRHPRYRERGCADRRQ